MHVFITELEVFFFFFQLFVVVVWNFELYMLPLGLLLLLVWNFLFCSGRDTTDMVSKCKRKSNIPPPPHPPTAAQTVTRALLSLPQQSMEAMFEWEDEDEDKDEKVDQPLVFASR